jgi:hypothetical protein
MSPARLVITAIISAGGSAQGPAATSRVILPLAIGK